MASRTGFVDWRVAGGWLTCVAAMLGLLATAAPAGTVHDMVGQLSVAEFQRLMDEELFTHDGDNRGWQSSGSPRMPTADHDAARDNIYDYFANLGLAVSLDPFTYGSYGGANNVIAVLPGRVNPDRVYVIGGHYDSVENPGADDNGSGTAGAMEAARAMSAWNFEHTIMFAAWDLEEKGLRGSWHWVNNEDESVVDGVANLDMIAYNHDGNDADTEGDNTATIYGSSAWRTTWVNAAAEYAPDLNVSAYTSNLPYSDHWPFQSNGRPAGGIIEDYPVSSNPYYHRQGDSYDTANYLDFDYAVKLLSTAVGLLGEEANVLLPGDVDANRSIGAVDVQAIVDAGRFSTGQSAAWPEGDFDHDADTDADDIQLVLATGMVGAGDYHDEDGAPPASGSLVAIVDVVTGEVTLDTAGTLITGFILRSQVGVLGGEAPDTLGGTFTTDGDAEISDQLGYTFSGSHSLGTVLTPGVLSGLDLIGDLSLTFTVDGGSGVLPGDIQLVPEPAVSLTGLLLLAAATWRRRRV